MLEGSASKQEQVQGVIVAFGAPVCFVQLTPAAHCGSRVANDLVMEHSAVDKAKGFNRIQVPFTFPLEEFILIAF